MLNNRHSLNEEAAGSVFRHLPLYYKEVRVLIFSEKKLYLIISKLRWDFISCELIYREIPSGVKWNRIS